MDHCLGHIWVNGPTVAGSWVTSMVSATTTGSAQPPETTLVPDGHAETR